MGIDYGMGMTNIDRKTGIRFGVIGGNKVSMDALEWSGEYIDAGWDEYRWILEDKEYIAEQDSYDNDIWVFKSPWVTRADFCSPCAPGAGYLGSCPEIGDGDGDLAGNCWAYALGPEFFDEYSPMPYRVIPAANVSLRGE